MKRIWNLLPAELWALLVGALLLRLSGLTYGLPLWLVDDEPPFILAALKMLEYKTLVPALYPSVFNGILYYPPLPSYILLPLFTVAVSILTVFFHVPLGELKILVGSDPSLFFILARVVSVCAGALSVFFIYRTALSLYRSRPAAFLSALLVATSLLHISLSMVGRHWILFSTVLSAMLYVLTRTTISEERRYAYVLVLIGLGCGISMITPIALVVVLGWYLAFSSKKFSELFFSRAIWNGGMIGLFLAGAFYLLHSGSTGIVVDITVENAKTLLGYVMSPVTALSYLAPSEPVLVVLGLLGILLLLVTKNRFGYIALAFLVAYISALFWFFRFESRFLVPVVIILSLSAGYVATFINYSRKKGLVLIALVCALPLVSAVMFSALVLQNDTRITARNWIESHVPQDTKVLVFARLTRIPSNSEAIAELETLSPEALRTVDRNERLSESPRPHVLNLSAIDNDEVLANIDSYAVKNGYKYVVYEPTHAERFPKTKEAFERLFADATPRASFEGLGYTFGLMSNMFTEPFTSLFSSARLGPTIYIYELPQ